MPIKFEIKDQLAKLLATEDLVVEHKDVSTASFNVDNRVLILPNWNKASNNVYDMLVGHEVGHALYTPNEDISKYSAPQSYINVTEDARIEKLIKRKFPGLSKNFYKGYWELNEQDFFELEGVELEELALIDRINLYYKGNTEVQFSDDEKIFVEKTGKTETFEEACNIAEEIHSYTRSLESGKGEQEQISEAEVDSDTEDGNVSGGKGDEGSGDSKNDPADLDTPSYEHEDMTDEELLDELNSDPVGGQSYRQVEEGMTDRNFKENIETLVGQNTGRESTYLQVPSVKLESIVVSTEEVWDYFDTKNKERVANAVEYGYNGRYWDPHFNLKDEYETFKKSAKKEVNYLVKEFECRKSASAYARSTTARTGVLDTAKLHTYKFNEDIFKKVNIIPEGKNHGLVFILDWSGSMQHVIKDTVKQLLNLVWFCRKVNIPFDVYCFTNEWYRNADDDRIPQIPYGELLHQEMVENELVVENYFNLLNVISSESSLVDFENHCRNLYCLANDTYNHPRLCLSGTPLDQTLVTLHTLIPDFKKRTNIEKLNVIVLTDGESQSLSYNRVFSKYNEDEEYVGQSGIHYDCVLRDRKLGRTYIVSDNYGRMTRPLLQNLSDKFSDVNFIGIRLLNGSEARRFIGHSAGYSYDETDKLMKKWKKEKSIALDNTGYKKYFGMSSSAIANDGEFEVDEDATKAQIKRAFVKSRGAKKLNKKILSQFMELIA